MANFRLQKQIEMILQKSKEQLQKEKQFNNSDDNYKFFYLDRKLSVNNPHKMPEALNQLARYLDILLEGQQDLTKRQKSYKMQLLNSIVIRLLDLLLNLKHFYLKNKVKYLLIKHQRHMSLVHNKDQISQVLFKSLRGADQYTRIISANIIPKYWNFIQKDLFAYHYLLEQLMINRIKIYSKKQKRNIVKCLKQILIKSKYISKLFIKDLEKLVLRIAFKPNKNQKQENKINQKSLLIKNKGIKPEIILFLCSIINFQASQSYKVMQTLIKVVQQFQICFKYYKISGNLLKTCKKYLNQIYLKLLSVNYKIIQLFFKHDMANKFQVKMQKLKYIMNTNYLINQQFILNCLAPEYQTQLKSMMHAQKFAQSQNSCELVNKLLDYFYQLKQKKLYKKASHTDLFKQNYDKMNTILVHLYVNKNISNIILQSKSTNLILLTYFSPNNFDNQILLILKDFYLKQHKIMSKIGIFKVIKVLIFTGNFNSAKFILQRLSQSLTGFDNKNSIFWKLYCNCYILSAQKQKQIVEHKKYLTLKLKKILLLSLVAKQFDLQIFYLLQIWTKIYKTILLFNEFEINDQKKKFALKNIATNISSIQIYYNSINYQLSEQLISIKQIVIQLKNNPSYHKLNQNLAQSKISSYAENFRSLTRCLYFSKSTILKIYRKLNSEQ